MDLQQKKKQKKVLTIISIVLYVIFIFKWNVIRITSAEVPYYLPILIAALICSIAAVKIKTESPGTGKDGLGVQGKWKCGCGAYNNDDENFCSSCGAQRPQPPTY